MSDDDGWDTSDHSRMLHASLYAGTLSEIDHTSDPPSARVQSGDVLTDFLPLPADIGRNYRRWRPCRVGTQCLIAAPSGDLSQGWIVALFEAEAMPPPAREAALDVVAFDDGTTITKSAVSLVIDSAVPVTIRASHITQDTPLVTITGDAVIGGISFLGHVHPGIVRGKANTDPPQG